MFLGGAFYRDVPELGPLVDLAISLRILSHDISVRGNGCCPESPAVAIRTHVTSHLPAFPADRFDLGWLKQFILGRFKQFILGRCVQSNPRRFGEFIFGWFKQFIEERSIIDHGWRQLFGGGMAVALTCHNLVSRAR